jgi:hypothetical protein
VTGDEDLLASILVTWNALEYSYYHYLDRDAFFDDMANGREDFCSDLLVNALLATAAVSVLVTFSYRQSFAYLVRLLTLRSQQVPKSRTDQSRSRKLL